MNTMNAVYIGIAEQDELNLFDRLPSELDAPVMIGDVLERMGNPVLRAKLANDAWWRGCKYDD